MVLHSLLFEQDPIELNNLHGCRIMVLVGCIELKTVSKQEFNVKIIYI